LKIGAGKASAIANECWEEYAKNWFWGVTNLFLTYKSYRFL
jgi:hypothetical protein